MEGGCIVTHVYDMYAIRVEGSGGGEECDRREKKAWTGEGRGALRGAGVTGRAAWGFCSAVHTRNRGGMGERCGSGRGCGPAVPLGEEYRDALADQQTHSEDIQGGGERLGRSGRRPLYRTLTSCYYPCQGMSAPS